MHSREKSIEFRIHGGSVKRKHRAVAAGLNRKADPQGAAFCHRSQLCSAPKIEVTLPCSVPDRDLRTFHVELVPVHDGPDRAIASWPPAGIDTRLQHWRVGLPLSADKVAGKFAFNSPYTPHRLGIPRSYLVPDAPDVLPRLHTHAIKKRILEIDVLVPLPAVGDVRHMPRFQPFEF